ncbi:MAG TPA: hypothetical protein DHV28_17135 [Ignavibacteriales bacterium]|nr:hypothetical protein [Ignavibacteriales bacterium]
MQIIHILDDFFYSLFPVNVGDKEQIIKFLTDYYTFSVFKPKVTITGNLVTVDVDTSLILSQDNDFKRTVSLCEQGKFDEAKPILENLIEKNPTNSEYHRIMGQILSDEGNQDEAINSLINALRWDSKNGWALLLMGNIFAKFKDDVRTARIYYDQALIAKPNDVTTLNNIGVNFLQLDKIEEAKQYFLKAVKINDQYPNALYALGKISETEGDFKSAFNSSLQAIRFNKNRDTLFQQSVNQLFNVAKHITKTEVGKKITKEYQVKLEVEGGTEIEIIEDATIKTAAKFEFAENYNKQKHTLRFNPKNLAVEHLIMHEMVHLDLVIEARNNELNQLFISTGSHKAAFIRGLEPTIRRLKKQGVPEDSIAKYCTGLFEGLNLQIYNTPIDLFIENFLYNNYIDLRPYQFLSLYSLINEGIKAVTEKRVVEISPPDILSKSKIYNLINAIQFRELYGIDLINEFKATTAELKQAEQFYGEYLDYKNDREPAEEYELVQHWAEDLKLDRFFELQEEIKFRRNKDSDSIFDQLENDPLGMNEPSPLQERDMKKFQESQKNIGTNMSVMWFMVDALKYFDGMPAAEIKKIALEIAMLGTQGYNPNKKDYILNSIPNKEFSGYHILSYYYVSFAMAIPDVLPELQLPFDEEYQMAKSLFAQK